MLRELRDGAGRPAYRRAETLAPPRRRSAAGGAAADVDDADAGPEGAAAQLQQARRPGSAPCVLCRAGIP